MSRLTWASVVDGARGHKYHAQRTTIDGIAFASKAEATRYAQLKLLERAGVIRALVLQPRYALYAYVARANSGSVDGTLRTIGYYVADFEYVTVATGAITTEDVKGVRTELFRWKKRHFELQYGRLLTEVGAKPVPLTRGPRGDA